MKKNLRLLVIGFIIQLTTNLGRFSYTLILPDMMKSLGLTITKMGILGTGIVIGYLVNSLLSGKLTNTIGAELTVKVSILLLSISLFTIGFFTHFSILLVSSIFLGAGVAGSYIPLISILNHFFKKRSRAFGIVMGGAGAGIMLGGYIIPPLLALSETFGYRICWYTLSFINFIVLIITLFFLNPDRSYINDKGEEHTEKNLIKILRGNTPLIITFTIYFFVGFSYIIYTTYFGAYSINEIGLSAYKTGMIWSLFGINMIYAGIICGILLDRFNKIDIAIIITSIFSFSVFLIIPFRAELLFYSSTLLFGFSLMSITVAIISIISDEVHKNEMAKTFGASIFIHGAGMVVGTYLGGFLKDVTNTFKVPLSISCFILFGCVFLFSILKKKKYVLKGYYSIHSGF